MQRRDYRQLNKLALAGCRLPWWLDSGTVGKVATMRLLPRGDRVLVTGGEYNEGNEESKRGKRETSAVIKDKECQSVECDQKNPAGLNAQGGNSSEEK